VVGFRYFELTEIVRQESDPEFAEMLRRFRVGQITEADKEILKSCVTDEKDALEMIGDSGTVYLAALNRNVDAANAVACQKLKPPNEDTIKLHSKDTNKCSRPADQLKVQQWLEIRKNEPTETGGVRGQIEVC